LALTTIPELGARSSKYSALLLMNAAVDIAYREFRTLVLPVWIRKTHES